MKIKYL